MLWVPQGQSIAEIEEESEKWFSQDKDHRLLYGETHQASKIMDYETKHMVVKSGTTVRNQFRVLIAHKKRERTKETYIE